MGSSLWCAPTGIHRSVANKSASDERVTSVSTPAIAARIVPRADRLPTLFGRAFQDPRMDVTVRVAGAEPTTVDLPTDATYAELLQAVDRSPQRATVLVGGEPVPADAPVDAEAVRVLELVKGG